RGDKEHEIWLLDKNPTRAEFIQKHGIKITGLSNIYILPKKIKITTLARQIGLADLVIIFVKSYDTKSAIKATLPCIGQKTSILTLQNGIGNVEIIKNYLVSYSPTFSLANLFAGITSHGATLLSYGKVKHAGAGETIISSEFKVQSSELNRICEFFSQAGIETKISNNQNGLLWSKLIINSAINPLGTITFRPNGELISNPYLKKLLCVTAEESAMVARKLKIKLLYDNPSEKVIEVCHKTAKNYNSMLQDILHNKKTEIDYINGAIIKYAKKLTLKLAIPLNNLLYSYIKKLEKFLTQEQKTL
ncbi:MAG: 2-dehydropantoate 2-reductase, partial [Elusimicrobiota bacterium]|nr:2-dehydropantoate 2-reductase [Elusimicrobiota bacterium]